jgi:hypothetical protein
MPDLDTYNRVDSLRKSRTTVMAIAFGFIVLVSVLMSSQLMDQRYWLAAVIAATSLCLSIVWRYFKNNPKTCKHCDTTLQTITRPMILSSIFLAMKGVKEGDYFFTLDEKGKTPFKNKWVKISHQSYVCHTCKVSEKNHHTVTELAAEHEVLTLRS